MGRDDSDVVSAPDPDIPEDEVRDLILFPFWNIKDLTTSPDT
jgi:hypothetical protein